MFLDKVAFRSLLDDGEKIVYVAHVHPFLIYGKLFKLILFGGAIPALGFLLFPPLYPFWITWMVIGALLFSYSVLQWYLDAWIVTNVAVIKQEWHTFFDKSTNRIEYGNIEGITNETKGFWGTVLSYGNIKIDHMSGTPIFLNSIASPRKLERIIMEHQEAFIENQNLSDHDKLKELLTNLIRSARK